MAHSYEQSKKIANKTIVILAIITVFEVFFALLGKGYLVPGFLMPHALLAIAMIVMSVVKAYLIIYEFMHMKYENKGLMILAFCPIVLLIGAMVALLNEGGAWHDSRQNIEILDRDGFQKPDSYSLDEYFLDFQYLL